MAREYIDKKELAIIILNSFRGKPGELSHYLSGYDLERLERAVITCLIDDFRHWVCIAEYLKIDIDDVYDSFYNGIEKISECLDDNEIKKAVACLSNYR